MHSCWAIYSITRNLTYRVDCIYIQCYVCISIDLCIRLKISYILLTEDSLNFGTSIVCLAIKKNKVVLHVLTWKDILDTLRFKKSNYLMECIVKSFICYK